MTKVDISSMFLVPKNIYTSMLSRINEKDVREDIISYNRQKEDNNYIEKAINFNQQQERQKNQIFLKPNQTNAITNTDYASNLMNQTARTDANDNIVYRPNLINQTTGTNNANTDIVYGPHWMSQNVGSDANTNYSNIESSNQNQSVANIEDQTMKSVSFAPVQGQAVNRNLSIGNIDNASNSIMEQAVASTPIRREATSIQSTTPSPILETFTKITDAKGNLICAFCRKSFPSKETLTQHLHLMHERDMSKYDQSKLIPIPEDSVDEDSDFFTPSNTITSFENTGAKPKQRKLKISAALTPYTLDEPDVVMPEQDSLSKTSSNEKKKLSAIERDIKKRKPVIIKFAKKRDIFDDVQPNPSKKLKIDTEYFQKKKKKGNKI